MERKIVDFYRDEEEDWTAKLDCGHSQHVRHNPPLVSRSWVLNESGRQAKLGSSLVCLRCDRLEFPSDYVPYHRTPIFDETSIPAKLRSEHATKTGIWAKIHLLSGKLTYTILPPIQRETLLDPSQEGIIVAEVLHYVKPEGNVQFYVEFYRNK